MSEGATYVADGHVRVRDPVYLIEKLKASAAAIERLVAERDEARTLADRLKLEAQGHAMEARGANATIYEIYQSDDLGRPRVVDSLYANDARIGDVRQRNHTKTPHPADGLTADVLVDRDAVQTIIDPTSFANGGPEWVMRYGDPESIRYTVASLLESYDYLLSDFITLKEATRRLRLLRRARQALKDAP